MFASKYKAPTPRLDGSTLWGSGHTVDTLKKFRPFRCKFLCRTEEGNNAFMMAKGGSSHTAIILDGSVYIVDIAPSAVSSMDPSTVIGKTIWTRKVDGWELKGSYGWGIDIAHRLTELG